VLKQSFEDYEVVVSDNSDNTETETLFSKIKAPKLKYVKRYPSVSAIDHLNLVLSEVKSEWFMMFHDDDIMLEEMLEKLNIASQQYKEAIAVGANAYIVKNGKEKGLYFQSEEENILLSNRSEIIYRYLKEKGIAPFPSYLYKKVVADKLRLNPKYGGKFCDAAFIIDLSNLGAVVLCAQPLMNYYIHKNQDSQSGYAQRFKLINYIIRTSNFKKGNVLVDKFRTHNLYLELKEELYKRRITVFSNKYFRVLRIIVRSLELEYIIKTIIISLIGASRELKHKYRRII
jgi:hypothetical protein